MRILMPYRTRGAFLTSLCMSMTCVVWSAFVLTANAQPAASAATEVIVQAASTAQLTTTIEALGDLRANETITLTSNETKKITRINFDDGQRVEKGQILVEMTSREESALLEEARFNTDEAKK